MSLLHHRSSASRAAALGTGLALGTLTLTLLLGRQATTTWPGWGSVPPEDALIALLLVVATTVCATATVLLALAVLVLLPHGWPTTRGTRTGAAAQQAGPRRPVHWVAAALITLAGAAPAQAAGPPSATGITVTAELGGDPGPALSDAMLRDTGRTQEDAVEVPVPDWDDLEDRRTEAQPDLVSPGPRPPQENLDQPGGPDRPDSVVVHRGDTLWGIAARHLGPDAAPADIAEEWPRWYVANRNAIGPDPDLIRPGTVLTAPSGGDDR